LFQETWSVLVFEETSIAFEETSIFSVETSGFFVGTSSFFEETAISSSFFVGTSSLFLRTLISFVETSRFSAEISISFVETATVLLKTLNVCVVMPTVFVVNLNVFFQTKRLFCVETWAGHVGTLNVLVEISRVVEMLSALEENDVSCCYGIRSEVRMVGACDIACFPFLSESYQTWKSWSFLKSLQAELCILLLEGYLCYSLPLQASSSLQGRGCDFFSTGRSY